MAGCRVYEIQGPDPSRTAGAVRCHRRARATIVVDDRQFNICEKHHRSAWSHFLGDGWLYAIDLVSTPPEKPTHS